MYIDYLQYGISSIDSSDITLLENAANACHLEQGEALFTARTLVNYLLNDAFVFADTCMYYNNTRLLPEENTSQAATNMKKFSIYPNPNNGNMQVNYLLPKGNIGKLSIKDVSGKTVAEYTLVPEHELLQISETALKNGVYFYICYVNNEPVVTGKLVIIH